MIICMLGVFKRSCEHTFLFEGILEHECGVILIIERYVKVTILKHILVLFYIT